MAMEQYQQNIKAANLVDDALKDLIPVTKHKKNKFFLNQSLIKQLVDRYGNTNPYCPLRIYEIYVKKEYHEMITESMMWGAYFENLVLGEKNLVALPKNKRTGDKLKDQIRIELQAQRFPDLMISHGVDIKPGINTYVPIIKKFDDNIYCSGEMDIFPAMYGYLDENDKVVMSPIIGDLKLTGDVKNTYSPYCWGAPQYMDHIQGDMYLWLIEDFDMELNKQQFPDKAHYYDMVFGRDSVYRKYIESKQFRFFYFVFGYKRDNLTEQFIAVERTREDDNKLRRKEFLQRVNAAIGELAISKENRWQVNPSTENCQNCPVSFLNGGECKKYSRFTQV